MQVPISVPSTLYAQGNSLIQSSNNPDQPQKRYLQSMDRIPGEPG